jgi:membrane protein DedA with SNARE-associated domain
LSFLKYSILTSIIVKTVYISIGYLWGISVKQLNAFLHWRKIAILYILIGILLFQCIKKFYQRIFKKIKKKID